MSQSLLCLRCNAFMQYVKTETLQLGQTGWLLGDLPNLLAGGLDVDIYICPQCHKIEFFQHQQTSTHSEIAQKQCPRCGHMHDIDYPKCPYCHYRYE